MDFHAAMETFAEAWVAANTQTAVNSDAQALKQTSVEDLPTLLPKDQLLERSSQGGGGNSAAGGGTVGGAGGGDVHRAEKTPSPKKPDTTSQSTGGSGKSLPIHCLVEQISGVPSFKGVTSSTCSSTAVELDSYAILPSSTLLTDLVRTALLKLGYTSVDAMNAKGAIQIKNWKPLTFDAITENAQATIDDILSELTNVATLRIRLASSAEKSSPKDWDDHSVRCAVQSLLKDVNQSTLAKLSPLCQSMISNIANGKYVNKLSSEKCREFGDWYQRYTSQNADFPSLDTKGVPKDTRLTFHPEHEVPLLRSWFKTSKTPTAEKLRFYANELNKSHVRQERPKVTPARLKIWWKNEKQKERRETKDRSAYMTTRSAYEQDSSRNVMLSGMVSSPNKPDLDGGGESRDLVFSGELQSMQSDVLPSCSFQDML